MGVAEPWERRCDSCDGTGRIIAHEWIVWQEEYDRLERIPDVLARLRTLADHVRRAPLVPEASTCPECGGEGIIITQQGVALLDFLDRRFGIRPRATSPGSRPARPHRLEPPRAPTPPEPPGGQDHWSPAAASVSPSPVDDTAADEPEPPMGGPPFPPRSAGLPNLPPVPSHQSTQGPAPPGGRRDVPASGTPPAPSQYDPGGAPATRPPWRSDDTGD
jgi:hypothetical protein